MGYKTQKATNYQTNELMGTDGDMVVTRAEGGWGEDEDGAGGQT